MADISKITVKNTTYDIYDLVRDDLYSLLNNIEYLYQNTLPNLTNTINQLNNRLSAAENLIVSL